MPFPEAGRRLAQFSETIIDKEAEILGLTRKEYLDLDPDERERRLRKMDEQAQGSVADRQTEGEVVPDEDSEAKREGE